MKLASIFFILLHTLLAWGEQDNEKREGTINDLFSEELEAYYSEEYVELKDTIEYDQENLISLFKKVEKKLDKQLEIISERGSEIIPTVSYDKIRNNGGKLPEGVADKVRKRGVLIVRNVIPKEEIEDMMTDLHKYLYKNGMYPPKNKDQVEFATFCCHMQCFSFPKACRHM